MRLFAATIAAFLLLAAPAGASRIRVQRFDVAPNGNRTVQLSGFGRDVQFTSIRVNGHALTIGDQHADGGATMYGEDVVLRLSQHGRRYSIRAASVSAKTAHLSVRFFYYAAP